MLRALRTAVSTACSITCWNTSVVLLIIFSFRYKKGVLLLRARQVRSRESPAQCSVPARDFLLVGLSMRTAIAAAGVRFPISLPTQLTPGVHSLTIVSMSKRTLDDMPHLTRTEAIILDVLLGDGSRERYGLEIVNGSNGRISRGAVYVVLSRMADKGLVESRPEPAPERAGGLPRVLYTPTGLGLRAYRAWAAAKSVWGAVSEAARSL